METKNKYLVPQSVIDCAEAMLNEKNLNVRSTYEQRIEATLKYCENALKQNQLTPKRIR